MKVVNLPDKSMVYVDWEGDGSRISIVTAEDFIASIRNEDEIIKFHTKVYGTQEQRAAFNLKNNLLWYAYHNDIPANWANNIYDALTKREIKHITRKMNEIYEIYPIYTPTHKLSLKGVRL